ncbi:MAG TPA: hypothetical protein VJN67_00120 [Stellaceae bacterium]|nr:hypothetical protein [Stellaceae bacterium]
MPPHAIRVENPPKPPPKTLVVGSSGHAHVTCVAWTALRSVNLKDFDAIVFNVASLDDRTILRLPNFGYFREVRQQLSLFLGSGGRIVALTPERRVIKDKDDERHNWEWCPIAIGTQDESGDTIEKKRAQFESYLSRLKNWTFYFFLPQGALSYELTDVFGSTYDTTYRLPPEAYAVNRYGKMLAGEVTLLITTPDGGNSKLGSITVLPFIEELEQKEAVNLILEDLIGLPQRSLPPDWIGQISMPGIDEINAKIAGKKATIEQLRQEIAAEEQERADVEKWKRVVYATGRELEQIFEEAVIKLGAKTRPAGAEEEFIFEHDGCAGVVECKGVGKSISLDHVRQADSHTLKFIEAESRDGKGVLLGNAWRTLPPSERGKSNTPVFPDNVVKHAAQRAIALVGAGDFLEAFSRFLKREVTGAAILNAIMAQSGVVDFRNIKS